MLNNIVFSFALIITFTLIELLYLRQWKAIKESFSFRDIFYFFLYSLALSPVIFGIANWMFKMTVEWTGFTIDLKINSVWKEVLLTIFIADVVNYFMHRAFHGKYLWPFHRTHHVTNTLYWGKSYVTHPVESIISFVPSFYMVSVLGLTGESMIYSLLIINFYSVWGHSKVDISYGFLDYIFISPKAHHIHHRREKDGVTKNIASFFSFLDICFGTFEKPNKQAIEYGASGEPWNNLHSQFIGPFKMFLGYFKSKNGDA